jgi:hypothetical protein
MVNKTQFYKTKVALAVVLSLGLAACGDSDGDANTSTSQSQTDSTQPVVDNQENLSGTISGKVQDTNGRAVPGAIVGFMGQETTTDTSGNYVFTNVPVTNLNGNNDAGSGNEDDEILSSLTVTVTGPEGYIGAVVTVTPQAVVNNTGTATNTGSGSTTSSDVAASTFVDGFVAEAGVAVIAEENSMVTGYLRIGNSTPAEGEVVYLDFTGYNATTQSTVANTTSGSSVTLTPGEYSAVTLADGSFTFENVPADSEFVLGVTGKSISTADTDTSGVVATDGAITVETTLEQDENFLGTFEVVDNEFAVEVDAEYNPWVASVDGVLNPTVGVTDGGVTYGDLNDGINKEVVVNFSEALNVTTFDTTKVVVSEAGAQYLATDSITLSPDGLSLTVVFTEELAPGTKFTVFIPQASSIDDEGYALNIVRNNTNASTVTNTLPYPTGSDTTIVFDELSAITNKAKYVKVNLCTFIDGTSGVEGGTAAQVFDESTTFDAGTTGLQSYSDAFRDAENSETNGNANDADIAQLNGQIAATEPKLKALGDAVLSVIGGGETLDEVDSNFPWVTVFTGNASTYSIDVITQDVDDNAVAKNSVFTASSSTSTLGADHGVDGAEDEDEIKVTFMDDFGVSAASETVTLIDAVPPVTVLQENYNLYSVAGYSQILSTAGEADYGNGGEVVNDGTSATAGNPLIWIQPRHLQQKGTNNAAPSRDAVNTYGTLLDLSARVDTGETATDIDATTFILGRPTYDATSYEDWAVVSNEIGVDFSENIATTTTAPTISGISTALSGYVANNNVTTDVDGNALNALAADLVQVTVADIMSLANTDNTGFIDFVGAVRDTSMSENVATADTNAKVIFRDAMPPLMTESTWNGTELTMVFNEAVSIDTATTVRLTNPVTGADLDLLVNPSTAATANGGFTLSADGKTVTLNTSAATTVANFFVGDTTGNAPSEDEFFYDDGAGSTADDQHAIIRWDNIDDANGNNWNTFTTAAADEDGNGDAFTGYAARYQVEAPQFLAVNELGSFTVSPQNIVGLSASGVADSDGNFVLTLNFSHPINVDAFDGADDIIQETELAALFYFDINGNNTNDAGDAIDPATDDISISSDNRTITISIDRAPGAFVVDTAWIRMITALESSFISTETILQDFNIRN